MAERTLTIHRPSSRTQVRASRLGGRSRRRKRAGGWTALPWLGPALLLLVGVVVYPTVEMVRASVSRYSITGLRLGPAADANYVKVLTHPATPTVLTNTLIWVGAVVVPTILLSLALAQLLSKEFTGRRLVRWAVLVPWAASLVITSRLFTLILDYYHGILNQMLLGAHVIDHPVDWLGDDRYTLVSICAVGVFVTVPFTTYVLLAGLASINPGIYEAARIDGAGPWRAYRHVTLPLLRPALLVAAVLNIIYVFNSFPVVYTLNDRNPGLSHETSITFMYKLAFKSAEHDVGMAAAAGVLNVALLLLAILGYLRLVDWRRDHP